ncbi:MULTISPECIES: hypothetical protein [Bacillaceae]|uniref:Molecular chaperone DnaJ n=1 Tax=Evansella alkalicola TaxID=745819 RepID=A0ABS6JN70_9BACI|nr:MULTISPECIES: hypothetical protein [Bacillaceae]MBU9719928.1 hypothetical protein [Bacillus alkalicola]
MNCEKCSGNGEVGCQKCHSGSMYKMSNGEMSERCDHCEGTGIVHCYQCAGSGRID